MEQARTAGRVERLKDDDLLVFQGQEGVARIWRIQEGTERGKVGVAWCRAAADTNTGYDIYASEAAAIEEVQRRLRLIFSKHRLQELGIYLSAPPRRVPWLTRLGRWLVTLGENR